MDSLEEKYSAKCFANLQPLHIDNGLDDTEPSIPELVNDFRRALDKWSKWQCNGLESTMKQLYLMHRWKQNQKEVDEDAPYDKDRQLYTQSQSSGLLDDPAHHKQKKT